MATIQEQLRAGSIGWPGDAFCVDGNVAEEAADVIDALQKTNAELVEVLVEVLVAVYDTHSDDEALGSELRSTIRAALSRARGDIPTES